MRPIVLLVVLASLTVAAPAPARAQIVNVQGALANEPEPGWSGGVSGGVDWQTGTTDVVRVFGAGTALHRRGAWLALALARGEYSEGAGVKLAEKTFEHLRIRRALTGRLSWEALAQHEYDAFRRLAVRAVAGTGPAVRLIDGERGALTCGAAYLLELEQRSVRADVGDSGQRGWHHRLSTYLTGRVRLGGGVTATQTLYVQPRLDTTDDLMLLSETAVESRLSARLSLINSLVVSYDAAPAETVDALATSLKVSVAVTF